MASAKVVEQFRCERFVHTLDGEDVEGKRHGSLTTVIGKLAKEKHDGPGRLRIETRGGLVEEYEESRFRSELDSDRETLPLFDVETHSNFSDESLGVSLHLEQLDDLFDVFELLRVRGGARLPQERAEAQRLPNSSRRHVHILLLTVTRLTLERDQQGLSGDEHGACNDASVDTLREDVAVEHLRETRLESGVCWQPMFATAD